MKANTNRSSLLMLRTLFALTFVALVLPHEASATIPTFCAYGSKPCDPHNQTSPCYQPPPKDPKCEPEECCKCNKSPGFVGSGVYSTDTVDLQLATAGFPLAVSRTYDSSHTMDGPMGYGWYSSLHARLHYTTYLYAAPSTYMKEADVIMPDGAHYRYVDQGNGTFQPPAGRYDTLVRNADGTYDLTLQRSRSVYHFGSDGALLSMIDDHGNELAWVYDLNGRIRGIEDLSGSGRYLEVFHGADGRISTVRDHAGRQVEYTYAPDGTLTTVTNPLGQITSYSYVAGRYGPLLSRVTDHWGRVISDMTWDEQGRVVTYTEQGETHTYHYAWLGNRSVTAKSDGSGNIAIYPFDADGLVTEDRMGEYGPVARTSYYSDGAIDTKTDETGVKTKYTYFSDGRVASVTRDFEGPLEVRFDYQYDSTFPEKVVAVTPRRKDAGGNYVHHPGWQGQRFEYHPAGSTAPGALHHVYRVHDDGVGADAIATYTYNAQGQVLSITDAAGAVTDHTYSLAGDLETVVTPANNDAGTRPQTTYTYDSLGRPMYVYDPEATDVYTNRRAYDLLDRVVAFYYNYESAAPLLLYDTVSYAYDRFDSVTGLLWTDVTDANQHVTSQGFDQFGRLIQSIDALGSTTTYTYTRSLLTAIADAHGNTTRYEYDTRKRLQATVFPDGARETYTYYDDGLMRTRTDRKNQTVTYEYDRLKRLTRKIHPGGTSITYTYDGQKLTSVADTTVTPNETHTFAYDSRFRTTGSTQGSRGTITYTHTPTDAVAGYSVSGGASASYTYYPDGSLDTIQWSPVAGTFKYRYRLRGNYESVTFPSGQVRQYGYDLWGRVTAVDNTHPSTGTLASFAYEYDIDHGTGARTRIDQRVKKTSTDASGTATWEKYYYDEVYQLGRIDSSSGSRIGYGYDEIGNRTGVSVGCWTTKNTCASYFQTYTYQTLGSNPNNWQRLLTSPEGDYTYDANGNTATIDVDAATLTWDIENRLTGMAGMVSASYRYDYQGRRSQKTVSGSSISYLYDGPNLVAEGNALPAATAEYLFGPSIDEPLAMSRAGAVYYYSVDALGSVVALTDTSGAIQNTYKYDAWGKPTATTETVPQPFRYTAREVGEMEGQYFYRARFYEAGVGRFLSEDPARGFHPYAYVESNPLYFIDPSGAVAVSRNTSHRGMDYADSGRMCRQPSARAMGCALLDVSTRCRCRAACAGAGWRASISMESQITVYVATDCNVPQDVIRGQEQLHVNSYNFIISDLEQAARIAEAISYPSEGACRLGCSAFNGVFQIDRVYSAVAGLLTDLLLHPPRTCYGSGLW